MSKPGERPNKNRFSRLPPVQNSCLLSVSIAVIAICISLVFIVFKTLNTVETIVTGLQIPFIESNIQETFQSTAFTASGNEGGILEVATAVTIETFTRKSELSLFEHNLPLGITVSEIQVPATYRYHIDLNAPWQISSQQSKCVVVAPEIRASLPVAFDTGKMKSKTASGWARWDKHENLKNLEHNLTDKLGKKAILADNIDKIRDEARLTIAKFIQNWLVSHKHWDADRFTEIIVLFPNEAAKDLPLPPPTIQLNAPATNPSVNPAL